MAAPHHRMGQFAGQPEHGGQVDIEHAVPVGISHADEQPVPGDAGIVDEDIDAFEIGLDLLAERLGLVAIGKVGWKQLDPVAELGGQSLQFSTRVPCRPTIAPWPCSTRAIASPMPPDAPVTSTLRPVNSNISVLSHICAAPIRARISAARYNRLCSPSRVR